MINLHSSTQPEQIQKKGPRFLFAPKISWNNGSGLITFSIHQTGSMSVTTSVYQFILVLMANKKLLAHSDTLCGGKI